MYNVFFGYTYDTGQTDEIFRGDFESDNMIKGLDGYEGQWAYRKAKATDESKDWDYDYIRRVNLMLDIFYYSEMSETEREHWRVWDISSVLINTFRCFLNLVIFLG